MHPGFLVKLRPSSPWRNAPESGARDGVDPVYHSDSLFSAVTLAMQKLGRMEEWLQATALAEKPAVMLSSCYPFVNETLLIIPPKNLWPPPSSSRVRWKAARFVPLSVVETLLGPGGRLREDDSWIVDAESECLLMTPKNGKTQSPFRVTIRKSAAVDRFTGVADEPVATACLEFGPNAGVWFTAVFADEEARESWGAPLTAALRLLADSGFGAERSRGWGRAEQPEIREGRFPGLLITEPSVAEAPAVAEGEQPAEAPAPTESGYWLLSLFSPRDSDLVDWSRGSYSLVTRNGRTESAAQHGAAKRALRMVGEGSVVMAAARPLGCSPDVAPEGFAHPVYRAGFALTIPVTWRVIA